MPDTELIEYVCAAIFVLAVAHTFATKHFEQLSHSNPRHAGLWHLLGEVEVVFGFWAMIMILAMSALSSMNDAITYVNSLNFTEPMFVFVILVIAGTRPILYVARKFIQLIVRIVPLPEPMAFYFIVLTLVPLLGSFITEPAAMALAALMLRDRYFAHDVPQSLKYATLGVLLTNVSIGGLLTPYAAPPVLMVATKWDWGISFMMQTFGWKSIVATLINGFGVTLIFRKTLRLLTHTEEEEQQKENTQRMPILVIIFQLIFLFGVVFFSHHPIVFMGIFMFFLGFSQAYPRYQDELLLREGLLVAFFLAGLIVLGGQQQWWLQSLLSGMSADVLFYGALSLSALTDNAALTYLGSLVEGISDQAKVALVTGAVTAGGLTVIANAPNPAAFAILSNGFDGQTISPISLFLYALLPTFVAIVCLHFF